MDNYFNSTFLSIEKILFENIGWIQERPTTTENNTNLHTEEL